jgi:hypothetical protein
MNIKFQERVGGFSVLTDSGKKLGDIEPGDDGFYFYWPTASGAWPSWIMRKIADKIDELDAPWKASIDAYFRNRPEEESP